MNTPRKGVEARLRATQEDSDEMARCLKQVEEWWLQEGKLAFVGAPACIFKVRELCAKIHFVPTKE